MKEVDNRVLICAPVGRDAATAADFIEKAGFQSKICSDFASLVAELRRGAGTVLLAEEALFGCDYVELKSWVSLQPTWSDLPFIVLTGKHDLAAVAAWRLRLVADLRNVALLERPVQTITLTSAIRAGVRARLRQYEVRALLHDRTRAAEELEAKVAARTAELAAANDELRSQMEERARAEAALRQAQRIEAIGQLTGGIAHDFNNLLMVISGGLEMLGRQNDPSRQKLLLEGMLQAAQRGASLTRQLLAFSRKTELKPEPVDIRSHVGAMRDLLARSLRGDVEVNMNFPSGLWPVDVDPAELELAVLNLTVNARDAMPTGGTIQIRAENVPASTEDSRERDYVRLSVVDTGVGMSEQVRLRVFEPFFTTKDIGRGSGLGLAQVHGFAMQSGGAVHIESEPGRGTSVSILLPRSMKPPTAKVQKEVGEQRDTAALQAGASVLLVEDDDEVAALVSEMFAELGYDVLRVASATAALGALSNGRPIDLVFSDVMMPGGMNGIDLAREIRQRRGNIPILLTSGYVDSTKATADREGLTILPKPYRMKELATALSALTSKH